MATSTPVAPENVRIVAADGREFHPPLIYVGVNEAGMHQWDACCPTWLATLGDLRIRADVIPPYTSIGFTFGSLDD